MFSLSKSDDLPKHNAVRFRQTQRVSIPDNAGDQAISDWRFLNRDTATSSSKRLLGESMLVTISTLRCVVGSSLPRIRDSLSVYGEVHQYADDLISAVTSDHIRYTVKILSQLSLANVPDSIFVVGLRAPLFRPPGRLCYELTLNSGSDNVHVEASCLVHDHYRVVSYHNSQLHTCKFSSFGTTSGPKFT